MITVNLGKSVHGESLRSFRSLSWNSSNNLANSRTKTFWEVKTNVSKNVFIRFLQMKNLVESLSVFEQRCLFDAPGILTDNLYLDALRAWRTEIPKKILWLRLAWLQELREQIPFSPNLYYTHKGNIKYQLSELRSPIRKVEKYTGYVRNSSQVGSKRSSKVFIPEPEIIKWTESVEIDYYLFLTVGEFDSGIPGSTVILKMDQRKVRNGNPELTSLLFKKL